MKYLIAMGVTAGIYAIMALGMNVNWGIAEVLTENQAIRDRGEAALAAMRADVKRMNFCGVEEMYGAAEVANAKILAGLLQEVPAR